MTATTKIDPVTLEVLRNALPLHGITTEKLAAAAAT